MERGCKYLDRVGCTDRFCCHLEEIWLFVVTALSLPNGNTRKVSFFFPQQGQRGLRGGLHLPAGEPGHGSGPSQGLVGCLLSENAKKVAGCLLFQK